MHRDAQGRLMNEVFGSVYANAYDLLYHDKDYAAECDLIESIFQSYCNGAVQSVLDLGCGTGNHAIPLASRGYEVVGVDHSKSMMACARSKLSRNVSISSLEFYECDIRTVDLMRQFDAALMMFAVLGYQLDNADVLSALRSTRRHLHPDGLLILDVWHGPAVVHQRPSERIKVIPTAEGKIVRLASAELDTKRHVCTIRFQLRKFIRNQLVDESEESHQMRYFFPRELELFLRSSGFVPKRLGAFPQFDQEPEETTWNVLQVAKAV